MEHESSLKGGVWSSLRKMGSPTETAEIFHMILDDIEPEFRPTADALAEFANSAGLTNIQQRNIERMMWSVICNSDELRAWRCDGASVDDFWECYQDTENWDFGYIEPTP